jgi:erythromycin esterase
MSLLLLAALLAAPDAVNIDGGRPAPRAVVNWIRDNAVPLEFAERGHGQRDLQPLARLIGPATVVGLGEATHGTREFAQLKHRLFEFLVDTMGFTVFAVEAAMTAGFELNDFVLGRQGDGGAVDRSAGFWRVKASEEMLDLLRWMRAYNEDSRHSRKLRIYGFDMLSAEPAAARVLQFLRRVDPESAESAQRAFGLLATRETQFGVYDLAVTDQAATIAGIQDLIGRFDDRRDAYVERSSRDEWEVARQCAVLVLQNAKIQAAGPRETEVRDRGMADNVRWIREREGPGARIVLSAHNDHVTLDPTDRMGAILRETVGAGYLGIGLVFNQGGFAAHEITSGQWAYDRVFNLGAAPAGSLDSTLARAGAGIAVLDLRRLPRGGPIADWFARPHGTREIGSGFDPRSEEAYLAQRIMPRRHDLLIFVEKTNAERRLLR